MEAFKAYCISCGEDVPVQKVDIGIEGEELLQCVHCNSYLGSVNEPRTLPNPASLPKLAAERQEELRPDETMGGDAIMPDLPQAMETPQKAGGALMQEEEASAAGRPGGPPLETAITVEDSSLISAILNDMLVGEGLARRVIACKNGYEFLGRYVRERKGAARVGLVVMDVKMPVLNGISAAVAMRAHEVAQEMDLVPILFFTSQRCDDTFRKVLLHCAPAMYINKGNSVSPADLQDRIGKIIHQLLREEW